MEEGENIFPFLTHHHQGTLNERKRKREELDVLLLMKKE